MNELKKCGIRNSGEQDPLICECVKRNEMSCDDTCEAMLDVVGDDDCVNLYSDDICSAESTLAGKPYGETCPDECKKTGNDDSHLRLGYTRRRAHPSGPSTKPRSV